MLVLTSTQQIPRTPMHTRAQQRPITKSRTGKGMEMLDSCRVLMALRARRRLADQRTKQRTKQQQKQQYTATLAL